MDEYSHVTDESNQTVLSTSLHSLSDGCLLPELETLGGVEGTVFEINDFTTVTPWEVFVSALDATLQEWSKMNVTQNTSITGTFLSTTLSYTDVRFSLSFYMHGDHQGHAVIPLCSYPHEMMSEDPTGDFPLRAHPVTRWYGIKNFALLSPYDPKHQQSWTLSQTRFLFSSLLPAMDASHYQLPIFFRAQESGRQMYVGVGHYDHRRTWFEMIHIRHVPPNLQYLSGLVELLKGKLSPTASLPSIKIQVSIKNMYRADCSSLMQFFPCSHPSPSQWDRLPYGSKTSPISSLTLSVCWPTQDESLVRDNQSFSDLNPLEASRWLLSCSAASDNECYLSSCLEAFASLFTHTDSISSLLDKLVPGSYLQTSEEQTRFRNALKHVTGRTEPKPRSLREADTPLKLNTLQNMMNYLFKPAPQRPTPQPSSFYKTAPPDSLTDRICLCASAVMFSHGGLPGLLQLWHDVISELRRAWETGEELPDTEGEMPDFQFGLLHQKLQMLQCCIRHKNSLSPLSPLCSPSPLNPLSSLKPLPDVRFDRTEGLVVISSPSASDSDEFFEAAEVLTSQDSEGEESVFQSLTSPEASGRLKGAGMVLMMTGEPMYIPVTQEHAPLTEDTLREQTHILSELGCSEEASILRASMQSLTLRSDMSAFKAANPGCVLEDFIRWYSPRDFIPMERGFSSMDIQSPLQDSPVPSVSFVSAVSSLGTLSPQDLTPVSDELGLISLDTSTALLLTVPPLPGGQSHALVEVAPSQTDTTPVTETPPTSDTPTGTGPPPLSDTPTGAGPPPLSDTPTGAGPPPLTDTPTGAEFPSISDTPTGTGPPPIFNALPSKEFPSISDTPTGTGPPPISDALPSKELPSISDTPTGTGPPPISDALPSKEFPSISDTPTGTGPPPISDALPSKELPSISDTPTGMGPPPISDALPSKELPSIYDTPTGTELPSISDTPTGAAPPLFSDTPTGKEPVPISDTAPVTETPSTFDTPTGKEFPSISDTPTGMGPPPISDALPSKELPSIYDTPTGTELPSISDTPTGAAPPLFSDTPTGKEPVPISDTAPVTETPSTFDTPTGKELPSISNALPAKEPPTPIHVRGRLSTRIRGTNSTWIQAWEDSAAVSAKRQKRLFDDTKEAEKVLQFLSTLSPCQLSCFVFPSLLHSALTHFASLPVATEPRCSELLGQLQSKLSELESLGVDYPDFSVKFCRECLSLLSRIDSHFCSVQATYHYLMHGFHVLNDVEMHTHFQEVDKEILGLAARLQRATSDVIELESGANSIQGQAVMGVFKSVLSSHSPFKRKMGLDGGGLNSAQPMFGKAVFREYVLRTICPNPQSYSTTCHHRLYAGLSQDETRIATAVSEDLRLF